MEGRLEDNRERSREEEDRIAAEQEFLEKHMRERKLSSGKTTPVPKGVDGGSTSAPSSLADSESEAEKKKRIRTSPEERKRAKARKTEDLDPEQEESEGGVTEDSLRNIAGVLRKMRSWFKQPTILKMVTKPQTERFECYMDQLEEELIKAREMRARLETRVEERGALLEMVRTTVREEMQKGNIEGTGGRTISYADAAAASRKVPKISGVRGPVLPAPKLVVVRHEKKESEEVKKTLKELVNPSKIGLKVRRVNKIRNGVIIETETEEGVEKLMRNEALQKAGMKVGKPTKRNPVIMVYDVRTDLKDEEIRQEVFNRNMEGSEIGKEEFDKGFQVRHRHKDNSGGRNAGKRSHIVVECSVGVRNWLRRQGRVFIEWESCRIKDFVDVARCYRCQRYGHVAKHCTSAKPSCSHCGEEHEFKECRNKGKPACINCKREGRIEDKHPVTWRECPGYERAVKRYNEQIDYGL